MTPGRRSLEFRTFDEIMNDVDQLLEGHATVGVWSLGQMCRHLAIVMRRTADLPASTPYDSSRWVGEDEKRKMLDTGFIPEGIPSSSAITPAEPLDDREEAEALRQAIAHYRSSAGPAIPHTRLGFLTREEWDRFHCIHAAHHLSFARPTAPAR